MRFYVLNTTSGIITNGYDNPDECLAKVQEENENNPDQIFTMVNI